MSDREQEYVAFVESVHSMLWRTAYLICAGDRHRADDVLQDGLCKLYVAWTRASRSPNLLAYARRVVINAAVDTGRRASSREVPLGSIPDGPGTAEQADWQAGHATRDEILIALAGLPPGQRSCIVLRYYEDLTIDETAALLGCSAGSVKSQSARGLASLRAAMDVSRSADRVS